MSQKPAKRSRRQTDEDNSQFKSPAPAKENGNEVNHEEPTHNEDIKAKVTEQNGTENVEKLEEKKIEEKTEIVKEPSQERVTRSRSKTPQMKKIEEINHFNGNSIDNGMSPVIEENFSELAKEENSLELAKEESSSELTKEEDADVDIDSGDVDILNDEPDPELVFDENSDLDSVKASPVPSRCQTRRSQTKSVPPPSTPKLGDDSIFPLPEVTQQTNDSTSPLPEIAQQTNDSTSPLPEIAQQTNDSTSPLPEITQQTYELNSSAESFFDNASTRAEAGSDITRLEYLEKEETTKSFLDNSKEQNFSDTLRNLSTRRSIRPLGDDYRKRVLRTNFDKSDMQNDRVMSVKRKNCGDIGEENQKRFKGDSPGFFSLFTSPLMNIRNPFRNETASSTPKLTAYKDEAFLLEKDIAKEKSVKIDNGERRWCSIM